MRRFIPVALVVLFLVVVATGDYTFQTSPSSGEFLQTSSGLSVRWEMRAGDSPDSPGVATPTTVSVSLGYKDSSEKPVVLFPPIGENVPVASLQFSWSTMDFNSFANPPVPPRDANTNWFILLGDQSTGYKSNGQLFHLIDAATLNPPTSSGPASVVPATSGTASTAASTRLTNSSAAPSATLSSSTGSPSSKSTSAANTAGGSSTFSGKPSASNTTSATATSGGSSVAAKSFVLRGAAFAAAALLCSC